MALRNKQFPKRNRDLLNRWSLALNIVTALLVVAFAILAAISYNHVRDLTTAKDDTSWIISQISYEHERLLLAAETGANQAELRLRGDIYISRVDLLRNAPVFSELRGNTSSEGVVKFYQSVNATDDLIDKAITPEDRQTLLAQLRMDSDTVRKETLALSRESFGIVARDLASQADDVQRYIIAFGALVLVVIGLSIAGAIISRRNMQLETQRNRADDASQLKSRFLSNMSHEIRTPLNGIIGTLQLIDDDSLSRGNKESIDIVRRSARSLLGIVNNILDISKIEAGETTISPQWFDTRVLTADVVSHNAGLINEKDIDLLVRFDETLPREMFSDRLKLEQVLNNLLTNALKFTEAGSVALQVRESDSRPSSAQGMASIEFIVSDTGIGISKEDQTKLFEPFKQIDSSLTRRYRGTGLGLSIARNLVEQLGGAITLWSKVGEGTSITVVIPHALANRSMFTGVIDEGIADSKPEIVLFGEYSTIFRATLSLTELGKNVRAISTQEEAEAFLKSPPNSVRAFVTDRRFGGDAIAWLNDFAEVNELRMALPIIIVRGTKTYLPRSTNLPVFEIEERFNRSSFLETLGEAVPSIGLPLSHAEPQGLGLDGEITEVIKRTKVLVVDDNSINRRVLVRLLKNAGVEDVEAVPGAIDAMKRLEQERFDLVFMDIQMPEIDGYMAARMIRDKGYKDVKILACSAHAFDSDIQRSFDQGLDGHIAKPIDAGELMALLKDAVQPPDQNRRT